MSPKRIILMYISEVSGHHSATLAIEKAIKMLQPATEILNINAFNYTNPISERIVNRLYMGLIKRTPGIWDYLYDNPKIVRKIEKIKNTIHRFNSPKLKNLFERFKPDCVVCTQAFPCGMVADFKKTYNSNIPLVAVLTDYIPHSYWIYDTVDYFITPAEDVSLRLIKKGVESNRIRPFGIPLDPKFNEKTDKDRVRKKFALDLNTPILLIMGGGHGLGPIKSIVKSLDKVKGNIQEIVITGINKKLYHYLKKRIKKYKKKILLFRFVNYVDKLMDISDLVITKPGGVTTAEVLAKNKPMLIINPIPGQEQSNALYLTEKGAAIRVDEPERINTVIEELIASPDKLRRMSECARLVSKPESSTEIAKLLLSL